MHYYNDHYGSGAELGAVFALLAGFLLFVFALGVAIYVVTAIFLTKLLQNAGHRMPLSGWVPVWSTASLMEIGGIKQPWIWTLIIFGGSILSGMIPGVGFILSLAVLAAAIVLTVYLAKGVQAGVGIGSTGGIVLAVLLPVIWIIWMSIASGKSRYDRDAAIREGSQMPMNWLGESDLYAPFGAPAPAGSGGSAAYPSGYQPSAPSYQSPAATQNPYGQQFAYTPPPTPESTQQGQQGWPPVPPAPVVPPRPPLPEVAAEPASLAPPVAPSAADQDDSLQSAEESHTPPAPPRFSASSPSRDSEESEDGDGNRAL